MKKTPDPILLLPAGYFTQGGVIWDALNENADSLVAKLRMRKDAFVVDIECATMLTHKTGLPAPAAGWVQPWNLQWRPDEGLYGAVEWTKNAKPGDYKEIAPCLPNNRGGAVLDILLWSLTSDQALMLEPVAVELRYKTEWDSSAALRIEFDCLEDFAAYERGMARQRR